MLKTGLPYNLDEMDTIANNGAIVDMNNINFPGIPEDKKIRTIYIYLRNTGFNNIEMDFSETNYDFKEKFILFYFNGDIEFNNRQIINEWVNILFNYNSVNYSQKANILSSEELKYFIKNNTPIINKVSNVFNSISVMLLYRMKKQNWKKDIKEDNFGIINIKNLANVLSEKSMVNLYTNMDYNKYDLINYTDIFSEQENDLFLAMLKSPLFIIMFGLSTTPTSKLERIIKACAEVKIK